MDRKLLPDGFGFTEDTYKFRLPEFQPTQSLNSRPRVTKEHIRNSSNGPNAGEKEVTGPNESVEDDTNTSFASRENDDELNINCMPVTDGCTSYIQTISNTASDHGKAQQQASTKSPPYTPLNDVDLEQDAIYVKGSVRETIPDGSKYAPDIYIDNSPLKLKQKPVAKKQIYIPHICHGKLEYDEFGAMLKTYQVKERDGTIYFRHILVKVKHDGPAETMGIEEKDEIVLLIGRFVPDVKHEVVLKLFHKIKVDGKTRFSMVIRRERGRWIWMELSAILAPEKGTEDYPIVEHLQRKRLTDNCHQYSDTREFYHVPGTQLYLQICNGIVSVDIMNNDTDKTKIIWKRVFVCQADDTGEFKFEASLSDETKKLYINIDRNKNIVLNSEPQLFQMFGAEGDFVRFRANAMYLGYDRLTRQVRAQVHDCVFEEFPVQNSSALDQSDGQWISHKEGDTTDGILPRFSSQKSTDSGRSSILSSQMSCESASSLLWQISRDSGKYSLSPQISRDSGKYSLSPQIITEGPDSDPFNFPSLGSPEHETPIDDWKLHMDSVGHDKEIGRDINDRLFQLSNKRYRPVQQDLEY